MGGAEIGEDLGLVGRAAPRAVDPEIDRAAGGLVHQRRQFQGAGGVGVAALGGERGELVVVMLEHHHQIHPPRGGEVALGQGKGLTREGLVLVVVVARHRAHPGVLQRFQETQGQGIGGVGRGGVQRVGAAGRGGGGGPRGQSDRGQNGECAKL